MTEVGQTRADPGPPFACLDGYMGSPRIGGMSPVSGSVECSCPASPLDEVTQRTLLSGYARGIMRRARSVIAWRASLARAA